ncbi:phage tail tube protein [Zoogloea sp.]|uniref:phage tail tube protein n=1 Tax=Zoogloea sp. TaxID=49181 RepID=UPI00141621A2|nr:MAG: hypothetical protein F9K15_02405 [Zoogloea sp.]
MATTAQSGSEFLLAIETDTPGTFVDVLSAKSNTFKITHGDIDVTTKADDGWGSTIAGKKSASGSVSGTLLGTAVDKKFLDHANTGAAFNCELTFGTFATATGTFRISDIQLDGQVDGAIQYTFNLTNVGAIAITVTP